MDNWKVVICLMISLSRLTSLTHWAKSWKHKTAQTRMNGSCTHEHTLTLMASRVMRRFSLSVRSVVCLTSSWRNTLQSQSERHGPNGPVGRSADVLVATGGTWGPSAWGPWANLWEKSVRCLLCWNTPDRRRREEAVSAKPSRDGSFAPTSVFLHALIKM